MTHVSYQKMLLLQKQVLKELKSEILLEADDINPDWIHFRESIVKDLALSHVFPSLEREFKHRLSEGAREFVKQQMAKTLWNYATRSPFKVNTVVHVCPITIEYIHGVP